LQCLYILGFVGEGELLWWQLRTDHNGQWIFSETSGLALHVPTNVIFSLTANSQTYYLLNGIGWTENTATAEAILSLSASDYGRGNSIMHNVVLTLTPPAPMSQPNVSPSGSPSIPSPNENFPPSNTTTPNSDSTSGLLGIGVGASWAVIAVAAVVFVLIIVGIIVLAVKCSSTKMEVV